MQPMIIYSSLSYFSYSVKVNTIYLLITVKKKCWKIKCVMFSRIEYILLSEN